MPAPEFLRAALIGYTAALFTTVPLALHLAHNDATNVMTEAIVDNVQRATRELTFSLHTSESNLTGKVCTPCAVCPDNRIHVACPVCPAVVPTLRSIQASPPAPPTGQPRWAEDLAAITASESQACMAPPFDVNATQASLRKVLRVWIDPGMRKCPVPKGLDAGLCVRASGGDGMWAEHRCLPIAVVIGAQKAGTRELHTYLTAHPRVDAPVKETGFFNHASAMSDGSYWRGYLNEFPVIPYADLDRIHTFEKTPEYLMMQEAEIRRIRDFMPSLKFIVQLRDPTERIYSWFNFKCKAVKQMRKVEAGPDNGAVVYFSTPENATEYPHKTSEAGCSPAVFRTLMLDRSSNTPKLIGPVGANGEKIPWYMAIERGHYADQLETWFRVWPRERHFMLVFLEHLSKKPVETLRSLETFIRIPHYPYDRILRNNSRGTFSLKSAHSKADMPPAAPMPKDMERLLRAHYKPHNQRLLALLKAEPKLMAYNARAAVEELQVLPGFSDEAD